MEGIEWFRGGVWEGAYRMGSFFLKVLGGAQVGCMY